MMEKRGVGRREKGMGGGSKEVVKEGGFEERKQTERGNPTKRFSPVEVQPKVKIHFKFSIAFKTERTRVGINVTNAQLDY